MNVPRLSLLHGPTPLTISPALSSLFGVELVVKRDDASSGAEAGNKIRKLEFLFADALARKATTIVTCGGLQSNHARATAIVATRLGLRTVLLLRTDADNAFGADVEAPKNALPTGGNVLLGRLVGAEIRLISPGDYADRDRVMQSVSTTLRTRGESPYVIPEGGSNGLGSLGYVEAMSEIAKQLRGGLTGGKPFDAIVHACGSGGTAAGVALGASAHNVAKKVYAIAVCDSEEYFTRVIARIVGEARMLDSSLGEPAEIAVDASAKGPRYAVMSDAQKEFLVRIARTSGLIADPVYTGKALDGLRILIERGAIARGSRVLFLHTGGLPGLLAQGDDLKGVL